MRAIDRSPVALLKYGVEKRVAIFFGALHKLGFDFVYRTRSNDASLGLPMNISNSSIDKTSKQSSGASENKSIPSVRFRLTINAVL